MRDGCRKKRRARASDSGVSLNDRCEKKRQETHPSLFSSAMSNESQTCFLSSFITEPAMKLRAIHKQLQAEVRRPSGMLFDEVIHPLPRARPANKFGDGKDTPVANHRCGLGCQDVLGKNIRR